MNKLDQSVELNEGEGGIEYVEVINDCNIVKIIILLSITSKNYLAEIDVASFIANMINELTNYVIFELDTINFQDSQVIHHDTFNNKTLVPFKKIVNQLSKGVYISFTERKQETYQSRIEEAIKIIRFIQAAFKLEETDQLYETTLDWIKKNISK